MYLSLKSEELRKIVESSDLPLVVYFYASWCGPCRKMAPEFEALSLELEGLYEFIKVSVDDSEAAAVEYKVSAVPTLVLIRHGKVLSTTSGFKNREQIRDAMAAAFN